MRNMLHRMQYAMLNTTKILNDMLRTEVFPHLEFVFIQEYREYGEIEMDRYLFWSGHAVWQ